MVNHLQITLALKTCGVAKSAMTWWQINRRGLLKYYPPNRWGVPLPVSFILRNLLLRLQNSPSVSLDSLSFQSAILSVSPDQMMALGPEHLMHFPPLVSFPTKKSISFQCHSQQRSYQLTLDNNYFNLFYWFFPGTLICSGGLNQMNK